MQSPTEVEGLMARIRKKNYSMNPHGFKILEECECLSNATDSKKRQLNVFSLVKNNVRFPNSNVFAIRTKK